MNEPSYKIEGMTIAVANMEQMLAFYSHTFQIRFKEKEMFGATLYGGEWGGLKLLFCPAELAKNTARQNRHQFDIQVADLQKTIEIAVKNGGTLMGEITETNGLKSIGVYDPDQNSVVFKEY